MNNKILSAQGAMLRLLEDLCMLREVRENNGTELVRALLKVTRERIDDATESLLTLGRAVTAELEELRDEGRANPTGGNVYQPKRGEWIGGEIGHCSVCGHEGCASDIWSEGLKEKGFCPYCGALIWEEGEE